MARVMAHAFGTQRRLATAAALLAALIAGLAWPPAPARAATLEMTLTGTVQNSSTETKVPIGSAVTLSLTYETLATPHTITSSGVSAYYTNVISALSIRVVSPSSEVLFDGADTGPFGYLNVVDDATNVAVGTHDRFSGEVAFATLAYPQGARTGSGATSPAQPATGLDSWVYNGNVGHLFRHASFRLPLFASVLGDLSIPAALTAADIQHANTGAPAGMSFQWVWDGVNVPGLDLNAGDGGPVNFGTSIDTLSVRDVAAVPLPATWPLFLTGLATIGVAGLRRRRRA